MIARLLTVGGIILENEDALDPTELYRELANKDRIRTADDASGKTDNQKVYQ